MILIKEAAEKLGITQKLLLKMIDEGKLPSYRLGQQVYVQQLDLDTLLAERGIHITKATCSADVPVSSLLASSGIFYDVPGTTRTEFLHNTLQLIPGLDKAMMEPVYRAFLAREDIGSTYLDHGIALPHVRDVIIGSQAQPLVSLSFAAQPLDWQAPDNTPVKAAFILIVPNGQTHMRLLGTLAQLMQNPTCLAAVANRASTDDILTVFKAAEQLL